MKGSLYSLLVCILAVHHVFSEDRVWTLAMGDDWGQHEYRDPSGYLAGFGPDFLDAICQEGRMDCRIVWMPYPYCFQSNLGSYPSGGPAIMERWADGCVSWSVTVERIRIAAFTNAWLKKFPGYLYVRRGESFDPDKLDGKIIGFLNGWSTSRICLERVLKPLKEHQVVYRDTTPEILKLLEDRKIDAVFNSELGWTTEQAARVTRIEREIYCSLGGLGLATRKDSALPAQFNVGFSKLKNSGRFAKFCQESNAKHNATLDCVD